MAAATRSRERVAPLPIGAWLSVWLRSLLLVTVLTGRSLFFDSLANGPHGSPCARCSSTPAVPPPLPARSAPHPATAALAPAPTLSARTPNCGAVGARRTLWLPGRGTASCTASCLLYTSDAADEEDSVDL